MNCKVVQPLLSAFIDEELSQPEAAEVKTHLQRCPCCREEEFEMRLLKRLIATAPEAEPPPGFEDRLFKNVFERDSQVCEDRPNFRESLIAFSGVTLMAASLTLLVLNFTATRQSNAEEREAAFAFEVRRDQATLAGADPFAANPTVVPTSYARR
jgi:anti-sigma factor RsiW